MSARRGAVLASILLLAMTACSRHLPDPAPEASPDAALESAPAPVELAGGPPPSASPAADEAPPLDGGPPADAPASDQPQAAPAPQADAEAEASATPSPPPSDPLEPVNRELYAVDGAISRVISHRPHVTVGRQPQVRAVAHAARNALSNLDEPSVAANDLLQRKVGRAFKAVARFVVNSTVGVAGLFDVARKMGLKRRDNDFGRTLQAYGAPSGPYIYVPVAGPMTLRSLAGAVAEGYLYPPHWLHLAATAGAALRGAGYAKLAERVVAHADTASGTRGGDGYLEARRAFYEAEAARQRPPHEAPKTVLYAAEDRD